MKSMQRLLYTSAIAALLNCECDRAIVTLHPPDAVVLYHNTQYDFTFSLPTNWQGYSVLFQIWEGHAIPEHGPMIVLRHPDRKSTRLNSSHANSSYAVFCLKKKTSLIK